jgi:hypothetical protein
MKSRARAEQWSEEVLLVKEEMRRVLCFLNWKATWWFEQGGLHQDISPEVHEGCIAYAAKQTDLLHNMAVSFAKEWQPILEGYGMHTMEWPEAYRQHISVPASASEKSINMGIQDEEFDDDMFFLI